MHKMSYKILVKKLEIERKLERIDGIITSEEIKKFCKNDSINLDYNSAISYLLNNNYLERIFRGIFYIRTLEEKRDRISKIGFIDAISRAMKLKKIEHWYFGLESALKLNNLTHETFVLDTIINNKIKNNKPLKILGHNVKFRKLSGIDYSFGIKSEKTNSGMKYYYSDPERTFLDMAYLGKYNGKTKREIRYELADYNTNSLVLKEHSEKYPNTVKEVFKE
jgi:predicted transcriptional regulator of viral defense system